MQQVELQVADEIKALGDAISGIIVDIKAKKSIAQIASDALPGLLQAVGGMQSLGADVKLVDNQVYLVRCLAQALEPAPVA